MNGECGHNKRQHANGHLIKDSFFSLLILFALFTIIV